jgi:hypothetical protein
MGIFRYRFENLFGGFSNQDSYEPINNQSYNNNQINSNNINNNTNNRSGFVPFGGRGTTLG